MNFTKKVPAFCIKKRDFSEIDDELSRIQGGSQTIPRPTKFRDKSASDLAFDLKRHSLSLVLNRDLQLFSPNAYRTGDLRAMGVPKFSGAVSLS